jgi:hypothetical protein
VFLGGPHSASSAAALSERSLFILRSVPNKISRQVYERLTKEANLLAEISRFFRDIELRVEILSLYETKETRVKVGRKEGKGFFSSYRQLIVSHLGPLPPCTLTRVGSSWMSMLQQLARPGNRVSRSQESMPICASLNKVMVNLTGA